MNRRSLSAVEKLQRAFAKEKRQLRRKKDANYRRFQNENSSDNEHRSAELSDDTTDDEHEATMHPQQRRVSGEKIKTRVSPPATEVVAHCSMGRHLGGKGKSSSRHVNAEVHVVPFDDKNVVMQEVQRNVLAETNQSVVDDISQRSQISDLSERRASNSPQSHVVEIHPELQASLDITRGNPRASRGDSGSSDENQGGNVENV